MCNGVLFRSAKIRHFIFTTKLLRDKVIKKPPSERLGGGKVGYGSSFS